MKEFKSGALVVCLAIAIECQREDNLRTLGYTIDTKMIKIWEEMLKTLRHGEEIQITQGK
jgi:hypothetical protein